MEPAKLKPVMEDMDEDVMDTYEHIDLAHLLEMLDEPRHAAGDPRRHRRRTFQEWTPTNLVLWLQAGGVPAGQTVTVNTAYHRYDPHEGKRVSKLSWAETVEKLKAEAARRGVTVYQLCYCWSTTFLAVAPMRYADVCEK